MYVRTHAFCTFLCYAFETEFMLQTNKYSFHIKTCFSDISYFDTKNFYHQRSSFFESLKKKPNRFLHSLLPKCEQKITKNYSHLL